LFPVLFISSEILPIIFYVSFAKRNKHKGLWVIFLYTLISLLTEFLFAPLKHTINPFYLYGSFTVCEYTLFTLFLYLSIQDKRLRLIPIIGSLIFYTIATVNFIGKPSEKFDSLSASLEGILIIIYSIIFLYQQIKDPAVVYVYYSKKFWVVIAFFLYFSSTLFLFIYAATLTNQEYKSYWYINDIFDIIKDLFFCIAFAMKEKTPSEYPADALYPDLY
jgi:hypothetical protein